jgi:hypothetical protein
MLANKHLFFEMNLSNYRSNQIGKIFTILNTSFLSNLGKGDSLKNKNTIIIKDIKEVIKNLKSKDFIDANSNAWEQMRVAILKDPDKKKIWMNFFPKWKNTIDKSIKSSKYFKQLLNDTKLSPVQIIGGFPFMGVLGEEILNDSKMNYFTSQLPIYFNGNIVCGYNGPKTNKYPINNFKIY